MAVEGIGRGATLTVGYPDRQALSETVTIKDHGEAARRIVEEVRTTRRPTPTPEDVTARIFVIHTRIEPLLGALEPLHTGPGTIGFGFSNQGGTLSVEGMLFVNDLLTSEEIAALEHRRSPHGIIIDRAEEGGP